MNRQNIESNNRIYGQVGTARPYPSMNPLENDPPPEWSTMGGRNTLLGQTAPETQTTPAQYPQVPLDRLEHKEPAGRNFLILPRPSPLALGPKCPLGTLSSMTWVRNILAPPRRTKQSHGRPTKARKTREPGMTTFDSPTPLKTLPVAEAGTYSLSPPPRIMQVCISVRVPYMAEGLEIGSGLRGYTRGAPTLIPT